MKKTKPTLDEQGVLNQRYSKGLVVSQLEALFDYKNITHTYDDANKIFHAWSLTHVDPEKRPRFFNVQDILKLKSPLYILTSAYADMQYEGRAYKIIHMKTGNWVRFGVPINAKLISMLGGEELLARLLLSNGVTGLIFRIELILNKIDSYETRDNVKANIKLLKDIQSGMLMEGM